MFNIITQGNQNPVPLHPLGKQKKQKTRRLRYTSQWVYRRIKRRSPEDRTKSKKHTIIFISRYSKK